MNKYMIIVNFYSEETYLYRRKFIIRADTEQDAKDFVSNTLNVLEFTNFKIMEVKAL